MRYIVDPIPEMVSQRLLPSFLHFRPLTAVIDPTCGRYCLKALLKHWIEVRHHQRVQDDGLLLTRPEKPGSSWFSPSAWLDVGQWDPHWIAYDPYVDFQQADTYLTRRSKPTDLDGWEDLLRTRGPVILSGILGAASVEHYILLIGVDTEAQTFIFKDPLTGDEVKEEGFATMQGRIDQNIIVANVIGMNDLPDVVEGRVQL